MLTERFKQLMKDILIELIDILSNSRDKISKITWVSDRVITDIQGYMGICFYQKKWML